jgi:predicted kinase
MNKKIVELYENIHKSVDKTVIIVRGVSGVGKSTFANIVAEPKVICTADDYFEQGGGYNFDPTKLGAAHKQSMDKFDKALENPNIANIVVANTNIKPSDYKYYEDKANVVGAKIIYVVLEKRHNNPNVHSVPDHVLQRQHETLRNNLKLM